MIRILSILYFVCSSLFAETSPCKHFTVASVDAEYSKDLVIHYQGKKVFSVGSGYGGYNDFCWSTDSRYLAAIDHGTKTGMYLVVFEVSSDKVIEIRLPDYRLNILGRYKKVEGGRYSFDSNLSWKGNILSFNTRGSLEEGLSDPRSDPENWYFHTISIEFGEEGNAPQPRLIEVKKQEEHKPQNKQE